MDKKLFRVKVILYVMAENSSAACAAATQAPFDIFECAARKADHIEAGWQDAIPYNSDDLRTCSEILVNRQQVTPLSIHFPTNTGRWEPGGQTLSNFVETRSSPN